MRRISKIFGAILMLSIAFVFVEYFLKWLEVPNYLIPRPTEVFEVVKLKFNYLLENTFTTVVESILGFLLGNSIAFLLAVGFHLFPRIEKAGLSVSVMIKAIPIIALAPLFVIWFGNGMFGKVLMAALVCFFPMLINTISGIKDVDPNLIDYTRSLSLSNIQIIRFVRIPSSLPYVFAALKTSSTISVVGAIIAELTGSDAGIGHILQVSVYQLETDLMFAAILFITVFGLTFYYSIEFLERKILKKYSYVQYQNN
ncbi:ABC transporter permease [Aureisphaera galaxeae]|uniref:ABC transporter permease n=1 Tax=Aureisphaera galaxeae TaxID=1538023 RepID=UPI00234FC24E|nr:ABC transporter permease [Aureisphaera galaxeae]MDC8002839.1 ABC transporter permease [Aureisphaera galaxeae]